MHEAEDLDKSQECSGALLSLTLHHGHCMFASGILNLDRDRVEEENDDNEDYRWDLGGTATWHLPQTESSTRHPQHRGLFGGARSPLGVISSRQKKGARRVKTMF